MRENAPQAKKFGKQNLIKENAPQARFL